MLKFLITPVEACQAWDSLPSDWRQEIDPTLTFGAVKEKSQLTQLLGKVDAAVLGLERIDGEVLCDTKQLKIISRFGVGYDSIHLEALRGKGIRLTNTPGAMTPGVVRQTIAFLLAGCHRLTLHDRRIKNGEWSRLPNAAPSETTLGLVGLGRIGREVARIAQFLGFRVAAYNRSPFDFPGIVRHTTLQALVEASAVISLHLPLNEETSGMISARNLPWFKERGFINTSRGGLVVERDLLQSLDRGEPAWYATDVFAQEPPTGVSLDLARHERVLATPHVAAMDRETAATMLYRAVGNALHSLKGHHEKVETYVL